MVCEKNMVGDERIYGCLGDIVEGGTKRCYFQVMKWGFGTSCIIASKMVGTMKRELRGQDWVLYRYKSCWWMDEVLSIVVSKTGHFWMPPCHHDPHLLGITNERDDESLISRRIKPCSIESTRDVI